MQPDWREAFVYAYRRDDKWWRNHRVTFAHVEQRIYVFSCVARLRWSMPFRGVKE